MKNFHRFFTVAVVILFAAACGGGGGGSGSSIDVRGDDDFEVSRGTDTAVRFFHAAVDTAPLTFKLGETTLFTGRYSQRLGYKKISPGDTLFTVERANSPGVTVTDITEVIEAGSEYTILLYGSLERGGIEFSVFPDVTERPEMGMALVRVVHAYQDAGSISMSVAGQTTPGAAYGSPTDYLLVPSGIQAITISSGGTVLTTVTVNLADRSDTSLFIVGSARLGFLVTKEVPDLD